MPSIFQYVSEFLSAGGLSEESSADIDLIVEELFTNMVKFNSDGRHEIEIGLEHDGDALLIRLRDFDVKGFDITKVPEPDLARILQEPRSGGLGLRLVRRWADSIRYDYVRRDSIVTVRKRVGA